MAKSTLSDFTIGPRLGKGSFGTVFKVVRKVDNHTYVMKIIPLGQIDSRGKQDAVNEVHILASLTHPYIVRYYDSFVENNSLYIVMEYCGKGDLNGVLRAQMGRLLAEEKIWRYLIQLCFGLEYIHSKKILHRDIKAMNVFLTGNDSLRIGDLGVAKKLMSTAAFAQTIVGTPYYLSPELCEDKPYNIKSDMWALGCVLYELCTMKHPFDANNQGALVMKIIRADFAPISAQYTSELREIVTMCLSKDFKRRPSAASILSRSGMRERALGLNILIPDGSVMAVAAIQFPSQVRPAEEEKSGKKPGEEIKRKPQQTPKAPVSAKAEQADARKPPKQQVDAPKSSIESPKPQLDKPKPVPKVSVELTPGNRQKAEDKQAKPGPFRPGKAHEVQPQRVRKGAPNQVARNAQQQVVKPPAAFPPSKGHRVTPTQQVTKQSESKNRAEELEEMKQVLDLPEYPDKKKKPSISDLRDDSPPVSTDTSDSQQSKQLKVEQFLMPSDPPVYSPEGNLHSGDEERLSDTEGFLEEQESEVGSRQDEGDVEEDGLEYNDFELSQTDADIPLPTYKPDEAEEKTFSVNYVTTAREIDEDEFVSSEEEEAIAQVVDPKESARQRRAVLLQTIATLSDKIESKRREIASKVGLSVYSELYSYFRASVDDSAIDQANIDAFIYSKLTMENSDVTLRQVVRLVYVILSLEIELHDAEEAVKALNFELI